MRRCRAPSAGEFPLKVFEGYQFARRAVVKSGSTADLSFTYQTRRLGMISYLGAAKIKYFEKKPDVSRLSKSEIESWQDYEAGPGTAQISAGAAPPPKMVSSTLS